MADIPKLRVLFFDVFGTCVVQRKPVADELHEATREALRAKNSALSDCVRKKAEAMSHDDWDKFGVEWDKVVEAYVREGKLKDSVNWRAVDEYRIQTLHNLLKSRGLIIPGKDTHASTMYTEEESLWSEQQLQHLGRIWHRLPPWPDTCRGLELLNRKYSTVTLSNAYTELSKELVAHSSIPFQHVFTSETFQSWKPNPKVYLGAAEKMGVKPEECALVAAHLSDLKGAKACGFYAISVERPQEEKTPELQKENIPNLVITEQQAGLIALAKRLGIEDEEDICT